MTGRMTAPVLALGLALLATLGAGAEGNRPEEGWIQVASTQWRSDAESGLALGVKGTTTLPQGSLIRMTLRFGEEIVGQGTLQFAPTGNEVAGALSSMSKALPPGEYWLTFETQMIDQPPAVVPAWTAVVGLVQRAEARVSVRLGTPEDEVGAHKRELEEWAHWFQNADPLLKSVVEPLGAGSLPDVAAAREGAAGLERSAPMLYAASYVPGVREKSILWVRKLEQLLASCESAMGADGKLPKSLPAMLKTLERSYAELRALAGVSADGSLQVARRMGGTYGNNDLGFQVSCPISGWSWVEADDDARKAVLESKEAAWKGCRVELYARGGGSEAGLDAFLDEVLKGLEKVRTVSQEPPATGESIQTSRGRKFSWKKDQTGYGWARAFLSNDGRMVVLVGLSSAQRWTEFQRVVGEVMKSLSFRKVE